MCRLKQQQENRHCKIVESIIASSFQFRVNLTDRNTCGWQGVLLSSRRHIYVEISILKYLFGAVFSSNSSRNRESWTTCAGKYTTECAAAKERDERRRARVVPYMSWNDALNDPFSPRYDAFRASGETGAVSATASSALSSPSSSTHSSC